MRWLIACEYSQTVTKAFRERGHEAYSCDLLPTEGNPEWHFQQDALEVAYGYQWDGMIAHPDCTYFTLAGARWFGDPRYPNRFEDRDRDRAITFWKKLWAAPIKKKAFENPQPLGYVTKRIGPYTQKLQPWMFGDPETKGICFWLDNLPLLEPEITKRPENIQERVWRMAPGPERKKERSRFFPGISRAMAEKWGG